MPYRVVLLSKVALQTSVPAGLMGLVWAANADAISSAIMILAGGMAIALVKLSPAIATLIKDLGPAIKQFMQDVGPALIEFRNGWRKKTDQIASAVDANSGRLDRTQETVDQLLEQVDRLTRRDQDKNNLLDMQREELTTIAAEHASLSIAIAERLGLVAPMADPKYFDPPADEGGSASRAVLLVEDDPATLRAYKGILRARGFKTASATDAAAAIALLPEGPTCVVLDIMLPNMGGEAVLRHIRDLGITARVVITTGIDDPERFRAIEELRPDALLRKPVDYQTLISAIRGDFVPPATRQSTPKPR